MSKADMALPFEEYGQCKEVGILAQIAFLWGLMRCLLTWENVISPVMRRTLEPSGPPLLKASLRKPLEVTEKQHHERSSDFITVTYKEWTLFIPMDELL